MMKRLLAAVVTTAFALAAIPDATRAEDTKLAVIVFPGVPNLPIFAAQAKGFFAKRGLDVDVRFTPNSEELRNGLAACGLLCRGQKGFGLQRKAKSIQRH